MRRRKNRVGSRIGRMFFTVFCVILFAAVLAAGLLILNPLQIRERLAAAVSDTQTEDMEAAEDAPSSEESESDDAVTAWEISIGAENQGEKFYYAGLTDQAEQQAYQTIARGLKDQEGEIRVNLTDPERVNALFDMVMRDYPGYFWCDGSAVTTAYTGAENYAVLTPGYLYDFDQRSRMQQEIDDAAAECLAGISADATEYRRIQHVYKWIVETVEYDAGASDNQNIYSVFVGKRSVCAGYARATQYLLEKLGVFCTYVTGEAKGNARHAWNLVRIGEDYYYVDTTWGDPVFQTEAEGEAQDYISYDYLCCDDTQLFLTHTPDPEYELPACTHMEYNYYVLNDMYYTTFDPDEILKKMDEVIAAKENPSVFKFSDRELYEEAHDEILGELLSQSIENLAKRYGLRTVRYQYLDEADLNKITIYWQYE